MPYLLLSASAFGAQALMFVPLVPMLVGTGVLAARAELQSALALAALTVGIAAGDFFWYWIGRIRGRAVLNRVCRIAMEPSNCLRRTQRLFGRYGAGLLLFVKFVPGMSTVALPLAGVFGMRPARFAAYDAAGVLLWAAAYMTLGYVSSEAVAAAGSAIRFRSGTWIVLALAALAGYVLWKMLRRRAALRQVRVARITVEELQSRLDAGEPLTIVDLRHPMDFESDPYVIPGAIYIPAEELAERHHDIPRDRETVLYCTCPDEMTSAIEALRLRRFGVRRVRPLQGGLSAWRAAGLPVESRGSPVPEAERMLNVA